MRWLSVQSPSSWRDVPAAEAWKHPSEIVPAPLDAKGISKGQATSRTRKISKGQGTGRGGKRQGQSCGGLSAPARKTEARPRQQAHHATSSGIARRANAWARARQFNATPPPA